MGAYRLSECLKARIGSRFSFRKILSLLQSVSQCLHMSFLCGVNPAKRERKRRSATVELRKPASALD